MTDADAQQRLARGVRRDASTELEHYFREAASWDADRVSAWRRSTRTAWTVAAAAASCALAASTALLVLMPLKRVEPFVIRVDNATGAVDEVPIYAGHADMSETVTRYFLTHYIQVCERFNFATAESDYEECGAFHGAQRNQAWYALWNPANAASPINLHKDGSAVATQVESVSFFKRANGLSDLAQVRYLKIERQVGGAARHMTHWIATIDYGYVAPASDLKIRRWNPLGFKVIDFVSEPEIIADAAPASAGSASAAP